MMRLHKNLYYVPSQFVEYHQMHLWKPREFFRDHSVNNRSKYKCKFNAIHDWSLVLVQQIHGFGCADVALKILRMFSPLPASLVYNRMYTVLGCSSIAGMRDVGCDP